MTTTKHHVTWKAGQRRFHLTCTCGWSSDRPFDLTSYGDRRRAIATRRRHEREGSR